MASEHETDDALAAIVSTLDAGELRIGQRDMARAISKAIATNGHIVVRAGTGTGKSLGYLVPAVLSDKRVIVATATKALQDQLAAHDLPLVAKAIGKSFTFEVLKGRSNYLCAQRVAEVDAGGVQGALDDGVDESLPAGRFADDVQTLLAWANETESGDQAELKKEPHHQVWSSFSVTSDECPGAFRCPSGSVCFAERARARAESADVVVVNLHLVGADIASGGLVLPEHDVLIVDEAHDFESILNGSLGRSLTGSQVRTVAALARRARRAAKSDAASSNDDLTEAIRLVSDAGDQLEKSLESGTDRRIDNPLEEELGRVLELLRSRIEQLDRALRAADGSPGDMSPEVTRALQSTARLRETIERLNALTDDDVAWIETTPRQAIQIAPIDVAPALREQVFATHAVVLTSATVPLDLARHLGASDNNLVELDVGSPFDYENHGVLYCAAHLPDRRQASSDELAFDEMESLINAAGGRTLALFTSWSAMRRATDALKKRVKFPIVAQGEQSKAALLDAFKSDPHTCLFATMSFWQGVDIPGETLSLVIIDRIPFSRPDDPLLSARRERIGRDAFRLIDLPRAASLLAQGAGRLIRTAEDRGVVAILDSRLATASYRWQLVRSLPPMRRTKDLEDVVAFLRSIGESAGGDRKAVTRS